MDLRGNVFAPKSVQRSQSASSTGVNYWSSNCISEVSFHLSETLANEQTDEHAVAYIHPSSMPFKTIINGV